MGNKFSEQSVNLEKEIPEDVLTEIKTQLAKIHFGSLEIQVHNGRIVQIELREKKRWDKTSPSQ